MIAVRIDTPEYLLAATREPDNWVIDNFIEQGDQVLLIGPPKAGKSLLASQMAIAVATGGDIFGYEVKVPRKVLYVNLELRDKQFGRRLLAQIGGEEKLRNATNLLTVNERRTINVLNHSEVKAFADAIVEAGVELVIWDVLVRTHGADENENTAMRKVMHQLRLASAEKAHIVVHHSRKPASGSEGSNQATVSSRGASSITGEADLLMTLAVRSGQGARYSLNFQARNIQEPEEMLLDRDNKTLLFKFSDEDAEDRLIKVVREAFTTSPTRTSREITDHLMTQYGVQQRTAKTHLQKAIQAGLMSRGRKGSSVIYTLGEALEDVPANDELFFDNELTA